MSSVRLTIGMPVYNGERFLATTVESLLAQEFDDFRLHISDNGSTDRTADIGRGLAKADSRVEYERQVENRGAAWNYNHLVHSADSELFKWATDDDAYEPTFLARCVGALDEHPDVVVAYTQAVDIDEEGAVIQKWGSRRVAWQDDPGERFSSIVRDEGLAFPVFGVMRYATLIDTRLHGTYPGCDIVLLAELALRGRFFEVPEPLFLHRDHPDRSVNAYARERSRAVWFDTSRVDAITLPKWRRAYEFHRATRAVDLDGRQRRTAYRALGNWMNRNRRSLVLNVGGAVRDHAIRAVSRGGPGRGSTVANSS